MGYCIELLDPITKEVATVEHAHYIQGGTYKVGGNTELTISITYNYAPYYYKIIKPKNTPSEEKEGIRAIYKMTALEAIPILEDAISKLKDDVHYDYWEATEGNAKRALNNLLTLCRMRPDAIIEGD